MGTRSLLSGQPQSKTTPDRRMGFGHLEVKKEFRIKKEVQDEEIKVSVWKIFLFLSEALNLQNG